MGPSPRARVLRGDRQGKDTEGHRGQKLPDLAVESRTRTCQLRTQGPPACPGVGGRWGADALEGTSVDKTSISDSRPLPV